MEVLGQQLYNKTRENVNVIFVSIAFTLILLKNYASTKHLH